MYCQSGNSGASAGEVPGGVQYGPDRHVHDTLLGAEPSQLRVARQPAMQLRQPLGSIGNRHPDDVGGKCGDGRDGDLVATPDREHQPVSVTGAVGTAVICTERDVGRRVIGVGVHRV